MSAWPAPRVLTPGAVASMALPPPLLPVTGRLRPPLPRPLPAPARTTEQRLPDWGAPQPTGGGPTGGELDGRPNAATPWSGGRSAAAATVLVAAGRFAALCWCWMVLWLALWSVVPMSVGWSPTVVGSGSMEPALPIGSVIHVDPGVDLDSIGAGTIVTFADPAVDGMRVTHRVVGLERRGDVVTGLRTKGDANGRPDSTIVPVADVHGVARLVVPYAGLPNTWVADGAWMALGLFVVLTAGAGAMATDTLMLFVTAGRRGGGRSGRQRCASAIAVAVAAMLGAPSTSAAFDATTQGASRFEMTTQWHLDAIDRESPIAHWRLGEPVGSTTTVITDDFESFTGYNAYGSGNFVSSTAQARSGVRSGLKTSNNDPNGGWKALPSTVTGSFVLDVWVYRPSGWAGGSIDRIGVEDASFNGYSFNVDHAGNSLLIDRRTGGVATGLGSPASFNPPEDAWYRLELVKSGSNLVLSAYDGGGTLLAVVAADDSTTSSFDRLVVHGGWNYYVDDLTITQTDPPLAAVDRIGTLDGSYDGTPAAGVAGLVVGDPDTAVDFDGSVDGVLVGDSTLINTSSRAERSVELWFRADTTTGRQAIYEEGGTVNGMVIYLDGATLYAHAWSNSTGWSNTLVTSTAIAAGTRYHVGVTLDAVGARQLTLYLDGAAVASATKTDTGLWNAHSDDGAIAAVNGGTKFHDGNAGSGFAFDGTIDEVVLFNSVLPAATVAAHHAAGR